MKMVLNIHTLKTQPIGEDEGYGKEALVTIKRDIHATNLDGYDDMQYYFAYEVFPEAKYVLQECVSQTEVDKKYYIEVYKVRCTYVPQDEHEFVDYDYDDFY